MNEKIEAAAQHFRYNKASRTLIPAHPGYYWAKWLKAADGTHEANEVSWPTHCWEIVQVNDNNVDDPADDEYLSVSVAGVRETQWREQFAWGPFVAPIAKVNESYPAALPPLRAREERQVSAVQITDAVWEVLSKWRPGMSDEVKHTLGTRIAECFARRADFILSSTAGQEWRDMLAALRDARMALYNPLEPDNQSLTYKRIDAAIIKAEAPAPPVAEPLLADKRMETK